jgi:hypothetical protein
MTWLSLDLLSIFLRTIGGKVARFSTGIAGTFLSIHSVRAMTVAITGHFVLFVRTLGGKMSLLIAYKACESFRHLDLSLVGSRLIGALRGVVARFFATVADDFLRGVEST